MKRPAGPASQPSHDAVSKSGAEDLKSIETRMASHVEGIMAAARKAAAQFQAEVERAASERAAQIETATAQRAQAVEVAELYLETSRRAVTALRLRLEAATAGIESERERLLSLAPAGRSLNDAGDADTASSVERTSSVAAGEAAYRFRDELERLVGEREVDRDIIERAARIAAADQSWRDGLGLLLDDEDVARLLNLSRGSVAELADRDELIVLTARDGSARYPAYQFHDGVSSPSLARAHRILVGSGYVSPWSASSWARTSHPELESRSPAQWAGERRDDALLVLVAERDAAAAAR